MFHHYQFHTFFATLSALLLPMSFGCGGKPQETFPVKGVVQWKDGKPATELAGATVELQIVEGPSLRVSPHGEVQSDGTFMLRSYEPNDGAPAGKYRAMIAPVLLADPGASIASSPLDSRYQSFTTTPMQVTVASQPNEIVLNVERSRRR